MTQPVAIFCFDFSTVMARPWAKAGYLCYCVDLQHPKGETRDGNIIRVGADIPTSPPACWTDQQPAPWRYMAFDSEKRRRELQGDSCDGCSKIEEKGEE